MSTPMNLSLNLDDTGYIPILENSYENYDSVSEKYDTGDYWGESSGSEEHVYTLEF